MRLSCCIIGAALTALILADAPAGAQSESRREGRIAFTFGESGDLHPSQLAVTDADGRNRRVVGPDHVYGLSWSPNGRVVAFAGGLGIDTTNVDAEGAGASSATAAALTGRATDGRSPSNVVTTSGSSI